MAERYYLHLGTSPRPTTPAEVAEYLTRLFNEGYSTGHIQGFLAALAFLNKAQGWHASTKDPLVDTAFKGIKKSRITSPDKRLPITGHILHRLLQASERVAGSSYLCSLFRAMMALGYYALLRSCEMVLSSSNSHALKLRNVSRNSSSYLLYFDTYKRSMENSAPLALYPDHLSPYCPVRLLDTYLHIRKGTSELLFILEDGQPVGRRDFAEHLRACANLCGLDSSRINTHSLRIGRATQLYLDGSPTEDIRRKGRWRSQAFLKYIRPRAVPLN